MLWEREVKREGGRELAMVGAWWQLDLSPELKKMATPGRLAALGGY